FRALGRDLQTAIQIDPRPTLWGTMVVVIELCKCCGVYLNNFAVWSRDRNHERISVCAGPAIGIERLQNKTERPGGPFESRRDDRRQQARDSPCTRAIFQSMVSRLK